MYLFVDLLQDLARCFHFFFKRAGELARIRKRPVQPSCDAGKNRTALRLRFIANGDDIGKQLSRFKNIEDGLGFVPGDVDPNFAKRFDRERIERALFKPGAVSFEKLTARFVEQRRRHLAAGAIVNTNEERFLFHRAIDQQDGDNKFSIRYLIGTNPTWATIF